MALAHDWSVQKTKMADSGDEYERPRKMPKTLKEKDSSKRLIVVLEKASLETVKVAFKPNKYCVKSA